MNADIRPDSDHILHAVIDATPDAVFVKDREGRYVLVNAAAARFIGLPAGEIIGKHDLDLYPLETARTFIETDRQVLTSGMPMSFEGVAQGGDGQRQTYLVTKGVCRDRNGTIVGLFGISHDITARKQAEEALRKAEVETQLRRGQKMEAIGRLAGGVAHDFNNLLTAMRGRCELLLEMPELTPRARAGVAEIQRAAMSASSLTRQLLAFSRQQVIERAVLDLNAVITSVGTMLQRLIGEDIDLGLVLDPRLPHVKGDSGQIEQILMNLAVNARDAMPVGGRLTIETMSVTLDEEFTRMYPDIVPGPHVMIEVTDTGSGMAADVQQRVFEPFFTTKGLKGTGLGLASVYGIVKQNHGVIVVDSEIGKGTAFKIYWPATGAALAPVDVIPASPDAGTETVLVVEDNEAVGEVVCLQLEQRGYRVHSASDANEAMRICAESGPFDLLLTDIVMPGMSGPVLATQLKARHDSLAVLFMSGYTDDTVVRHSVAESGVPFLQKPFTGQELAVKVRRVLDSAAVSSQGQRSLA
jgi:two-component system, cell cycle sensor histidine kinase and response regulator CckA